MTYSTSSTVRLIAGRLALDFINTANWSDDGTVIDEKLSNRADLQIWMEALSLTEASECATIEDLLALRAMLRSDFLGDERSLNISLFDYVSPPKSQLTSNDLTVSHLPLVNLIVISAISILSDPREYQRLKKCPGHNCGWLFIDETKNARRKWCIMETCGNRSKAARNYAKKTRQQRR